MTRINYAPPPPPDAVFDEEGSRDYRAEATAKLAKDFAQHCAANPGDVTTLTAWLAQQAVVVKADNIYQGERHREHITEYFALYDPVAPHSWEYPAQALRLVMEMIDGLRRERNHFLEGLGLVDVALLDAVLKDGPMETSVRDWLEKGRAMRLKTPADTLIEELKAKVETLTTALQPFATAADHVPDGLQSTLRIWNGETAEHHDLLDLSATTADLLAAKRAYEGMMS